MPSIAAPVRALVVDDDAVVRRVVRRILERLGISVAEAADVGSARAELAREPVALLLLDLDLNGEDGLELLRAPIDAGRSASVLVLSCSDDDATIGRAYAAGVTDFVVKPVTPTVLALRVRNALRQQQMREELQRSRTSLAHAEQLARLCSFEIELPAGGLVLREESRHLLGLAADGAPPTVDDLIARIEPEQRAGWRAWFDRVASGVSERPIEHAIERMDHHQRVLRMQAELEIDARSGARRLLCIAHDITDRRRVEEELAYQSFHDELTGLANRRQFQDHLEEAVRAAPANRSSVAVLFLNLDRFKAVNESLGHGTGDRLLVTVAERLRDCVRATDRLARLARLGGDEFALLLAGLRDPRDATRVAERLIEVLAEPFAIDGHDLCITTCIGIAVYPADAGDPQELLKAAETALDHAKQRGRSSFTCFEQNMNALIQQRVELESDLRHAIDRREIEVWYQPRVELKSGRIVGMEALARWRHPVRGLIPPTTFIPIAEETGLITAIGEQVLHAAVQQCRRWHDTGFGELRLAVNLSANQFRQQDLADRIARILAEHGFAGSALELELTESLLMRNVDANLRILERLRALGIHLAVDDFGTGYSSLAYLKRFPIDCLKIDKSFIENVTTNAEDASITATIVTMAHNLKLDVVAEGVETEAQLEFLRAQRCDQVQGFYFSRPVPADAATLLLTAQIVEPLPA